MNLSDAKGMLCNCDGTMSLDGTKLAKACGAEGGCTIATSLCRTETGDLAAAMRYARDANRSLLIACTQETSVFDAIAEEIECPLPATINIRERIPFVTLVLIVMGFAVLMIDPPSVLLAICVVYSLSGPFKALWAKVKSEKVVEESD